MAFQRPFLISLKRTDGSEKWGFSIHGGKEYDQPLQVQIVSEDSIAEAGGLRENDEIIQVGRVNVQDLNLGQVHELLARCGNKIEMFVIREDLLTPRKGKEPPVVKAVVHNPYNSPLNLYSTENIADTLARQTEVLTEGHLSAEEEEGPENLSFKEKSAVFQLLEEQAKQESPGRTQPRATQQSTIKKPKAAPPPPPKPKPPSNEQLYNGYETGSSQRQVYQDQHSTRKVEIQTSQKVYQTQQEQPVQYQQSSVYQASSYQKSPGYQSPSYESSHSPVSNYQQSLGYNAPGKNYQQSYQQVNQSSYQQPQSHHSPASSGQHNYPGYQSPVTTTYQPLNQINYQQAQNIQGRGQGYQPPSYQPQPQKTYHSPRSQHSPSAVSKAEFKIGPPPPPRGSSAKQDTGDMTAVYRQQYEQHLQQQYQQQHQIYMNNYEHEGSPPKAHIIRDNIFENNTTSGTPITYKAPPAAPPKPHWPPPPQQNDQLRFTREVSPSTMSVSSVWPPKKSAVTNLPKTGFNPAAVREQGTGRRCVWPPPNDEMRSGRNTPQSPITGRRIQWNPSPSPPLSRKAAFGTSQSPSRRKDIQWPPPSPNAMNHEKENYPRPSPRLSRKARFDDYVKEHASINVPQTYRPPPGTQHVEYR